MKLLVFTQKVDKNESTLGFFHAWLVELSKRFESVGVVCLEKGEFDLPKNVTVYSLGKESGIKRFGYIKNFYKYLFLIRGSYDRVFVHMNQEYILLGGLYWRIKGIPVYLWRNHPIGNIFTRVAAFFSTRVFYTSTASFVAKFSKSTIMPAGIDIDMFKPIDGILRNKYSICMVGRIAPIKHVDMALEAVNILICSGEQISFSIIGSILEKDKNYLESLKKYVVKNNLSAYVHFFPGVSHDKLPEIYSSHEICINLTESGSFDKTIVESASCGAIPLVSNSSLEHLLPNACITLQDKYSISESIKLLLLPHQKIELQGGLDSFVKSQSLSALMDKLSLEMKQYV
jgi:glycosyltransferase involved in cell wall biosynthesis